MTRTMKSQLFATLAALAVAGAAVAPARAQTEAGQAAARPAAPAKPKKAQKAKLVAQTAASKQAARRGLYYQRSWGIDIVGVRRVSSGVMLRFDYRVVDPRKAAPLNDRHNKPYVIDESTRTALAVPAMEKIGELRQVAPPETGRTYFMIFGNPGGLVKSGSRVTVVAGNFRAPGLIVE